MDRKAGWISVLTSTRKAVFSEKMIIAKEIREVVVSYSGEKKSPNLNVLPHEMRPHIYFNWLETLSFFTMGHEGRTPNKVLRGQHHACPT